MRRRLSSLLMASIAFLFLAVPAFAQGDRGSITGQITDTTGAVIPNVEVTATQLTTNMVSKAVTTSTGVYRMEYLQPGSYRISAGLAGIQDGRRGAGGGRGGVGSDGGPDIASWAPPTRASP